MELEVNTFKPLVGIKVADTEQDEVIAFLLANVEEIILNYCNLAKLPAGLKFTAYRMAMDLYRNEQVGAASTENPISSLSEGDLSIGFNGSIYEASFTQSLLKGYEKQLNRYRRLIW